MIRHFTSAVLSLRARPTGRSVFSATFAALLLALLPPGKARAEIVAWGQNTDGQTTVPGAAQTGVTAVAAGINYAVALKTDGSVIAWGNNDFGQTTVPAAAQSGVIALAAGQSHNLALKSDGSVIAWGRNNQAQATVPAAAQSGVTAIAAGDFHSLALKSDGSVIAWGANGNGQTTVPPAAQSGVVAIAAGFETTVAVKDDGSVIAWGLNASGQTTVPAAAQSGVTAINAGAFHTVALKSDGSVIAWGSNGNGQTTVPAAALSGVIAIEAAGNSTVALKSDGSVISWGSNGAGQTTVPAAAQSGVTAIAANGNFVVALKNAPQVVAWGENGFGQSTVPAAAQSGVKAIAGGGGHTVALESGGSVIAWGDDSQGEATVPAEAQSGVAAIAAGESHSVALKSDGSVVAWGYNVYGQATAPVEAQSGVIAIAAGAYHTVALKSDGSVIAWGRGDAGQTTVPAAAQSGVAAIAAGDSHTVALKSDGSVVAWGNNDDGQTTVPSEAQSGVKAIAVGVFHTVALKSDGSVIAWGNNEAGQTTVPAAAQSDVKRIAAGYYFTVALESDGSVIVWGDNTFGQTTVPASVQSASTLVAAGGNHSLALVEPSANPPTVTTPASADVTVASATLGGDVTADGGIAITERGVVFSLTADNDDPQIGGNGVTKLSATGTTGIFTVSATGLAARATYTFKAFATNITGTTYTSAATFTTLNTAPVAPDVAVTATNGQEKLIVLAFDDVDADGDAVTLTSVDAVAHVTIDDFEGRAVLFTPEAGYMGEATFTYTLEDGFGGTAIGTVTVNVTRTPVTGGPVPDTDGTFAKFGTPQTGAFAGTLKEGRAKAAAIFAPDGSVLLQTGVDGIAKLGAPSGDAAFVILKPGNAITAKNNVQLVTGLLTGTPVVAAQTGTPAAGLPTGVTIKRFLALDGHGSTTFFLALLHGTGVTSSNNLALCAALGDGSLNIVARKNQELTFGETIHNVATLATLAGSKGTLAARRWRIDDDTFGVRVTFLNKQQAIFAVPASTTSAADWTLLAQTGSITGGPLDGTTAVSFGLPGFGANGSAQVVNLAKNLGGVTAADNVALTRGLALLARKGSEAPDADGAPMAGVLFKALADPLSGANGAVAFAGTLSGAGVKGTNNRGLWHAADGATPKLLARAGDPAPGGGHWKSFTSMVLPGDPARGPIFLGTLAVSAADGITARNNLRLWAVDSTDTLRLVFRAGQVASANGETKEVKTFTALAPAPGSIGAASGYDDDGNIALLVTFTDRTQALLMVKVL